MPQGSQQDVNQILVDHLNEIASTLTDHLKRTVKRAARSLQRHSTLVLTKQDALAVHGIGTWVATQLEVFILNNPQLFPSASNNATHAQNTFQQQKTYRSTAADLPVHSDRNQPLNSPLEIPCSTRNRSRGTGRGCGRGRGHPQFASITPGLFDDDELPELHSGDPSSRPTSLGPPCTQGYSAAVVLSDGDASIDNLFPSTRQRMRGRGGRGCERGGPVRTRKGERAVSETNRTDLEGAEIIAANNGPDEAAPSSVPSRQNATQKKVYRPPYRSAPCAILLALRQAMEGNITTMRKVELAEAAQPFCDTQILTSSNDEQHTWYDGWSCVNKTLIRKGYVAKFGNPAKFQLTMEGRLLADSLATEYESAAACTVSKFFTQSTVVPGSCSGSASHVTVIPTEANLRRRHASQQRDDNDLGIVSRDTGLHRESAQVQNEASHHLRMRSIQIPTTDTGSQSSPSHISAPRAPLATAPPQHSTEVPSSSHALASTGVPRSHIAQATLPTRQLASSAVLEAPSEHLHNERPNFHLGFPQSSGENTRVLSTATPRSSIPSDSFGLQEVGALCDASVPRQERVGSSMVHPATQCRAGSPLQSKNRVTSKRFSKAQVERSVRVIKRLRQYQEEDCLTALRGVFLVGDFPKTDDKLYDIMSNSLWKQKCEESNGDASSHDVARGSPLQNSISRDSGESQQENDVSDQDVNNVIGGSERLGGLSTGRHAHSPKISSQKNIETIALDSPNPGARPLPQSRRFRSPEVIEIDDDVDDEDEVEDLIGTTPILPQKPTLEDGCHANYRDSVTNSNRIHSNTAEEFTTHLRQGTRSCIFEDSIDVPHDSAINGSAIEVGDAESEGTIEEEHDPVLLDLQRSVDMSVYESVNGASIVTAVQRPSSQTLVTTGTTANSRAERNTVIVVLDTMERFRNGLTNQNWKTMAELLEEAGAACEVRTLPCGDAIFVSRYEDGSEVVLDYVIERKTVEDFASSVRDGRVSKQAFMMRKSGIENRLFVIEGDMRENKRVYENPGLLKKLTELEVCEDFYVKHTKDLMDTVWFYASFRRRLEAKFGCVPKATLQVGRAKFDDWEENMKRLWRSLTLEQLFTMQLCQTPGVGERRARTVLNRGIRTPQLLHRAYKEMEQESDREKLLAGPNDGIGKTASRTVCQLFTAMNYGTIMTATSSLSRSRGRNQSNSLSQESVQVIPEMHLL